MKTNIPVNPAHAGGTYPGFAYPAGQLAKFLAATDLFTILLKNGHIIHYTAADKDAFKQWLLANGVEDIKV